MTKGIRLAICIPCYGDTKAKFTLSLSQALIHFLQCKLVDEHEEDVPREVEMFFVSCSMLTQSRTQLVSEALNWGATHLLWLDADHVFPPDTIVRLLSHGRDIVGANYARRFIPTAPTASGTVEADDGDGDPVKGLVYTTMEKAHDGALEEVAHLGFGVCLMNMRVLDLLQIEADKTDGNFLPLFQFDTIPGKLGVIGEDVYFFGKCREAGARVFVDHALSWEVGHITDFIMTNAHAVAQRKKWADYHEAKKQKLNDRIEELEAVSEMELTDAG